MNIFIKTKHMEFISHFLFFRQLLNIFKRKGRNKLIIYKNKKFINKFIKNLRCTFIIFCNIGIINIQK